MDHANQAETDLMKNNAFSNKSTGSRITRNCSRCRNHGLKVSQKGHKKDCMYRNCVCVFCKLFSPRRSTKSRRIRLKTPTLDKDSTSLSIDWWSFVGSWPQSAKNLKGSYDSSSSDLSVSNHESNETQDGNNDVTRITSSTKPVSSKKLPSATKSLPQWQNGTDSNVSSDASSSTSNNGNILRTAKTCSLCRNHNIVNIYKGHKRYCQYLYCFCPPCCKTRKNRKIMAAQTAVNRARIQDEAQIEKLYKLMKPKIPPQQVNHVPTISQPAWSVEGNYGGDGINNLVNTPTLRKVPIDPMNPFLIDSIQSEPGVDVEIILARSMTLLQQFQNPWDILTLLYVTVKYAGANLYEAIRRIHEVEQWILEIYSMLERYIKEYILFVLYKIHTIYILVLN
ncbi:PREDICTED: uncharacterized protein LOC106792437 [Polistes canadensis]|uniref:uncharacterized protein LOC106792437 n=1 Tax=Polistes canadensis TaxID=91411 RepID=UPI000718D9BF|nr:PREDICTED: uncharacterized protein LOC106792437 [Polistes canadensis]XP_014614354.1 PREDICTED: uncharacterized protein LOC106792437 [Polistes canadensis]